MNTEQKHVQSLNDPAQTHFPEMLEKACLAISEFKVEEFWKVCPETGALPSGHTVVGMVLLGCCRRLPATKVGWRETPTRSWLFYCPEDYQSLGVRHLNGPIFSAGFGALMVLSERPDLQRSPEFWARASGLVSSQDHVGIDRWVRLHGLDVSLPAAGRKLPKPRF